MKWFYEIWEDSSYIQKYDAKGNLLEWFLVCWKKSIILLLLNYQMKWPWVTFMELLHLVNKL